MELITHAHAVRERSNIQIPQLKRLSQMHQSQRMSRLLNDIKIALLVHVVHHLRHIVLNIDSKFMQTIKKSDQGMTQVFAHERSAEDEGEEVPRGYMVDVGLIFAGVRRGWYVKFELAVGVVGPCSQFAWCSCRWSFGDEEAFDEREALVG